MRMFELWRVSPRQELEVRLEDAGGPVLFLRRCDAEESLLHYHWTNLQGAGYVVSPSVLFLTFPADLWLKVFLQVYMLYA